MTHQRTATGVAAPRVYLSGPMSGLPGLNFAAFDAAAHQLRTQGLTVVNPTELNPDPSAAWHDCMRRDIQALCDCTHIALLPGWQHSQGAMLELQIAHRLGLVVLTSIDDAIREHTPTTPLGDPAPCQPHNNAASTTAALPA